MIRFQEGAVSSQISCVAEINFGRTAIATANNNCLPSQAKCETHGLNNTHVLLEAHVARHAFMSCLKNDLLTKKTKSITRIVACIIVIMTRIKMVMTWINSIRSLCRSIRRTHW